MSRDQGVSDEKLEAVADFENSPVFSDVEKIVLRYADGMTRTPLDVSDETFQELSEHFTHRQLVELTSCIGWENYRARFDHAFGIESEGFSAGAYCAVPA